MFSINFDVQNIRLILTYFFEIKLPLTQVIFWVQGPLCQAQAKIWDCRGAPKFLLQTVVSIDASDAFFASFPVNALPQNRLAWSVVVANPITAEDNASGPPNGIWNLFWTY